MTEIPELQHSGLDCHGLHALAMTKKGKTENDLIITHRESGSTALVMTKNRNNDETMEKELSLRGRLVRGNPGFGIVGCPKGRRGGITTVWTGLPDWARNDRCNGITPVWTGLPRAKRPRNGGGTKQ